MTRREISSLVDGTSSSADGHFRIRGKLLSVGQYDNSLGAYVVRGRLKKQENGPFLNASTELGKLDPSYFTA